MAMSTQPSREKYRPLVPLSMADGYIVSTGGRRAVEAGIPFGALGAPRAFPDTQGPRRAGKTQVCFSCVVRRGWPAAKGFVGFCVQSSAESGRKSARMDSNGVTHLSV